MEIDLKEIKREFNRFEPLSVDGITLDSYVHEIPFSWLISGDSNIPRAMSFRANKQFIVHDDGKEEELTRVHSNITIVGVNEDSLWYLQSSSCQHNTQNYDLYRYDFNAWFNHNQKISEVFGNGNLLNTNLHFYISLNLGTIWILKKTMSFQ